MTPTTFRLEDWGIVAAGASIRPPFDSTWMDEATNYPLEMVAATILGIPGVQLVHDRTPDWWHWRARWSWEDAIIDVEMTTWEASDGTEGWGGSPLSGSSGPSALKRFFSQVHQALPCAWLHNSNCELHSEVSFSECYGAG